MICETFQSVREDLATGRYAAWYRLTHHGLWTLLRERPGTPDS